MNSETTSCPVEKALGAACGAVRRAGKECCEDCADQIRRSPVASVMAAAGAGYILSFLPVAALLGALLGLLLRLIKPMLILFGVIKVAHLIRGSCCCACEDEDSERDPVIDSPVGPAQS